jgi:hypothetical protein
MKHMIDWMSIKLNAICFIGLIHPNMITYTLTIFATVTTIAYNVIKISKEFKTRKRKKNEVRISQIDAT